MCRALKGGVSAKVRDPCVSRLLLPAEESFDFLETSVTGISPLNSPHSCKARERMLAAVSTLHVEWDTVGILQILLCGVCE